MNQNITGKQGNEKVMPKELVDYMSSLPGSMTNNSRSIVRSTWERIRDQHPVTVRNILSAKFGIDVDIDFEPGRDDGEPPVPWERLK